MYLTTEFQPTNLSFIQKEDAMRMRFLVMLSAHLLGCGTETDETGTPVIQQANPVSSDSALKHSDEREMRPMADSLVFKSRRLALETDAEEVATTFAPKPAQAREHVPVDSPADNDVEEEQIIEEEPIFEEVIVQEEEIIE